MPGWRRPGGFVRRLHHRCPHRPLEIHRLIEQLWRRHGFTALLVTHDVAEAVALADRVLLIDRGGLALDATVTLPRPRSRTAPGFAALEDRVLRQIIGNPAGG